MKVNHPKSMNAAVNAMGTIRIHFVLKLQTTNTCTHSAAKLLNM